MKCEIKMNVINKKFQHIMITKQKMIHIQDQYMALVKNKSMNISKILCNNKVVNMYFPIKYVKKKPVR